MKIIRARLQPYGGNSEYLTLKRKIVNLIIENPKDSFNFNIDGFRKDFGPDNINPELVGKTAVICQGPEMAKFNEDGSIEVIFPQNESLPREHTVQQLRKLRKMTRGVDIGDRISDMNKQGANIQYIQNPVDSGIESYEDFEKKNKSFVPSWNLKHLLSPYGHDKKKDNK